MRLLKVNHPDTCLCIIVDEEKGAADQLMRGEEWRTDATILDQLQTVQEHVPIATVADEGTEDL